MKIYLLLLILGFTVILSAANVQALFIIPDNYGANYYCYLETCSKMGWQITTAAVSEVVTPCPNYAGLLGCGNVTVDALISEINDPGEYDCIMLMSSTSVSGNPCYDLLNDVDTLVLLGLADAEDVVIWAGCSAIRVLASAGLVNGVNVQCPTSYNGELTAAGANIVGSKIPPVIDGNIVTTMRGQYYTSQNIFAILTAMSALNNEEVRK
ncbi:MAG: DJ-1/PfpI family protein [Candidatus Cloacimonetes bacterium]|nr:DJ-1/PfpI family protein [Candidatus Cloacimonadota bacterium]